jgi:TolA-binding protein
MKESGDCPAAIRDFLAVIERDAAAQNTRFLLAECYEKSGDKTSALTHYNEYLTRFPEGRRAGDAKSALKRLSKS